MALSQDEIDRLDHIIAVLGDCMQRLNSRSREFVEQTQKRYEEHGAEIRLSPRQWEWLESLMDQFG